MGTIDMTGRHCILGACVMLAGCNLLSGAADLVTGEADPDAGAAPDDPTNAEGGSKPREVVEGGAADARLGTDASSLDGSSDGADAGRPRPDGGRFVFVTSTVSNGNLGGLAGGDSRCNKLAATAGLGGTWVAWLSTRGVGGPGGPVNAIDRVTSVGPWYLVNGQLAVANKSSLQTDQIDHGIDRDEKGVAVGGEGVWTGTRGGAAFFGDCNDWMATTPVPGTIGKTNARDPSWTAAMPLGCDGTNRLYCFEK